MDNLSVCQSYAADAATATGCSERTFFRLPVGVLIPEAGFFSRHIVRAPDSFRKILRKLALHLILITPAPIAEFRLDGQADSDPLADFKRASLASRPAIKNAAPGRKKPITG